MIYGPDDKPIPVANFVRATLKTSIFTAQPREHLYHYTTIEGVKGICTSRTIWATDLLYMNDPSEYRYASKIIERRVAAPWNKVPPPEKRQQ